MTDNPIAAAVAPGCAFAGPALELGALMSDVPNKIPLGMLNRHGLVAGATGTRRTETLQLLAEQLSSNGDRVPGHLLRARRSGHGHSAPSGDDVVPAAKEHAPLSAGRAPAKRRPPTCRPAPSRSAKPSTVGVGGR